MKRGKPLKRGKGLERKSELRADVEKVRAFMQRGRQQLERAPISRKQQEKPQEGPLTPAQWRAAVFDASGGRCVITGARAQDADDRRFQAHHPLPKRELRARGLFGRVWDARNGVWLRRDVHARHELAFARVPADKLPASVWAFCEELDAEAGTRWATDLVLRAHPKHSQQEVDDGRRGDGHRPEGEGRRAGS